MTQNIAGLIDAERERIQGTIDKSAEAYGEHGRREDLAILLALEATRQTLDLLIEVQLRALALMDDRLPESD